MRELKFEPRRFSSLSPQILRDNGLAFSWDPRAGKGGHGKLGVGQRFTIVKSGEITPTMKQVLLKQLGLPKDVV